MTPSKIKKLRLDAGLTVKDFASKFGLSSGTVYSWENGNRNIPQITWDYIKLNCKLMR